MKKSLKTSHRFREQLRQELQTWQTDGLITSEQSTAINQRYGLDQLARESTNILLFAIYVIGTVLVAGGIISFVAAHWDKITPAVKVVLIVSFMLICHASGIYLWKVSAKSPRLGHALILLGTLIFGANIGLMAQIFHIKSNFYNGLFAWAVGATIMAYAIASVPNAVVAVIVSFIGFCFWIEDHPYAFSYYPFIAAVVFIGFACIYRSVFTFFLALLAVGISVLTCAVYTGRELTAFILAAIAIAMFYYPLGLLADRIDRFKSFALPAVSIAVLLIAGTLYFCSFEDIVDEMGPPKAGIWIIQPASLGALAVIAWACVFTSVLGSPNKRTSALTLLASTALLACAMFVQIYSADQNRLLLGIILTNLACAILCAGLIANGFIAQDRRPFWAGILFAALIITSRFLEYETGLLLKAAVFTACGIALILAGVTFENHLKKRRLAK